MKEGVIFGSVQLSEGPAHGLEIIAGVATGWAVASLLAVVLAGMAGLRISRQMSRPLLDLTSVTMSMAGSDLSARAKAKRPDDFGILAGTFNQ